MTKKYYKISEVADLLKVSQPTLRFWEKEFYKFLDIKRSNNTRRYTSDDIEILKCIKFLLKDSKYSIDGAKVKLKNEKQKVTAQSKIVEKLKNIKAELISIRKELDTTAFIESVIVD